VSELKTNNLPFQYQNSMADNSHCYFTVTLLVPLRGWPAWSLQTKLYKFGWNTFLNNVQMKNRTDLNLGEVVYISIIYHSWLNLLNGFFLILDGMTVKTCSHKGPKVFFFFWGSGGWFSPSGCAWLFLVGNSLCKNFFKKIQTQDLESRKHLLNSFPIAPLT